LRNRAKACACGAILAILVAVPAWPASAATPKRHAKPQTLLQAFPLKPKGTSRHQPHKHQPVRSPAAVHHPPAHQASSSSGKVRAVIEMVLLVAIVLTLTSAILRRQGRASGDVRTPAAPGAPSAAVPATTLASRGPPPPGPSSPAAVSTPEPQPPAEPPRPVEPKLPAEPPRPVEPKLPAEPPRPVEPKLPAQPPRPVEPKLPAQPPRPVEPKLPAQPPRPVEPKLPAQPPQPLEPRLPTAPERPTAPPSRTAVPTALSELRRRAAPVVARQPTLPAVAKRLLAGPAALSRRRQATNGRAASISPGPRSAPPSPSAALPSPVPASTAPGPPEPTTPPVVAAGYPEAVAEPRHSATSEGSTVAAPAPQPARAPTRPPAPQRTEVAPAPRAHRSPPAGPSATGQGEVCQIRWARVNGRSEFQAVALRPEDGSGSLVARSPGFRWRIPVSPDATPAATAAHEALVRQLLATGWEPLGRGGVLWYEDRFRARPSNSTELHAAAAPRAVCEIKWVKVDGRSEFQAVTSSPEGGADVLVGRSPSFGWRLPVSPDATPAAAAAHGTLVRQLLAAGWESFERGGLLHWYGERFRAPPPDDQEQESDA
jgi:hypothetical protein